jgi:hypothetical protein
MPLLSVVLNNPHVFIDLSNASATSWSLTKMLNKCSVVCCFAGRALGRHSKRMNAAKTVFIFLTTVGNALLTVSGSHNFLDNSRTCSSPAIFPITFDIDTLQVVQTNDIGSSYCTQPVIVRGGSLDSVYLSPPRFSRRHGTGRITCYPYGLNNRFW